MSRIKNRLSVKIFLGIALILLSVCLLMFGILRVFMPKTYQNEIASKLSDNTSILATQLETQPQDQWESILMQFCLENNTGVDIFNEDKEVIAKFSISAYSGDDNTTMQIESNYASSFSAIFENNGQSYIITTYVNNIAVDQVTDIFAKVFPYVFIFILFISVLAAFFYSRFLAKPIVDISNVSKKMTALNMSWRCDTSRLDEIGVLAGNLNDMAVRLDSAMNELQAANEKLKLDIEKEREQDKRRRDFFSAISHELKTPVTILKGELDGMILNVGKFKDRDKYLQEAFETTETVEKLVKEILTLAKLDTLKTTLKRTALTSLLDECCQMYELTAQNKRIEINRHYDCECYVQADSNQLRTALSNIIGNAVKHSPMDGKIDVYILQTDDEVKLSVANVGAHINENELPQIWEPFYRTDKSRSRDTGGSGLGLYIVKTILDNHNLKYQLENTDAGIEFTIVFSI